MAAPSWWPAKTATITGAYDGNDYEARLLPGTDMFVGLSFGADTLLDHLTIDCSGNEKQDCAFQLYANGQDLTIGENVETIPYPNDTVSPYPCVTAGGTNLAPEATECGTIVIRSGHYSEIIPNGWYNESGAGAEIYLSGGVTVDYLNYTGESTEAQFYVTDGSEENPTVILEMDNWATIKQLTVQQGGYLQLAGDGAIREGAITNLAVEGGGTLRLPSGERVHIPGAITGDTALSLLPGDGTGEGFLDGLALGTYITGGEASTADFTLQNEVGATIVRVSDGDGTKWDLVPAFTVTYTDGVEGEEIFADQVISRLPAGTQTPAFDGAPVRPGYRFTGWSPAPAATVTADVVYTAQWEHVHAWSEDWSSDEQQHWHGCEYCQEKDAVAAHAFGEWKVTKEPTATEKGLRERSCSVCGYSQTEEMDQVAEVPGTGADVPAALYFLPVVGLAVLALSRRKGMPGDR